MYESMTPIPGLNSRRLFLFYLTHRLLTLFTSDTGGLFCISGILYKITCQLKNNPASRDNFWFIYYFRIENSWETIISQPPLIFNKL